MKSLASAPLTRRLSPVVCTFIALATGACAESVQRPARTASSSSSSPLLLGLAGDFSVLAATTVTNAGPTTLARDLGLSPGTAVTGGPVVLGAVHVADDVAISAQLAAGAAAAALADLACDHTLSTPDLTGLNLVAGVYCFDEGALLTGSVTLDGAGDGASEFVFLVGSTLTVVSGASVVLIRGAQPCNVHWNIGSAATIGSNAVVVGDLLALASVSLQTNAQLHGRALARTGAVTLDSNIIVTSDCVDIAVEVGEGEGESGEGEGESDVGEGEGEGDIGEGEGEGDIGKGEGEGDIGEGEGEGDIGEGEGEGDIGEGEGEGEGVSEEVCGCVDFLTDIDNCGFCGNACGEGATCDNGVCNGGCET